LPQQRLPDVWGMSGNAARTPTYAQDFGDDAGAVEYDTAGPCLPPIVENPQPKE